MARRRRLAALGGLGAGIAQGGQQVYAEQQRQQRETRAARLAMVKDFTDKVMSGTLNAQQAEQGANQMGARVPKGFFDTLQPSESTRLSSAMEPIEKATSAQTMPTRQTINTRLQSKDLNPITTSDTPSQFIQPGMEMTQLNPDASAQMGAKRQALTNAVPETKIGESTDVRSATSNLPPEFSDPSMMPTFQNPIDYQPVDIYGKQDPFTGTTSETRRTPSGPSAITAGLAKGAETEAEAGGKGRAEAEVERITGPGKLAAKVSEEKALSPIRVQEDLAKKRGEQKLIMDQLGMLPQQQTAVFQLADDFEQRSKPFEIREQAYREMTRFVDDPSPAGDLGIVFTFMKLLDPSSTVREGEQAMATNAVGVPDQLKNLYNRLLTGERLTVNRGDLFKQAENIYRSASVDQQRTIDTYTQRAVQMRVPPSLVVRESAPDLQQRSTRSAVKALLQKNGLSTDDAAIDLFLKNNPNFK